MHADRPNLVIVLSIIGATLAAEFMMDVIWKMRYYGWGDFRVYYAAAAALNTGEDIYNIDALSQVWREKGDVDLISYLHHVFPYPPLFAVLLRPLTAVPVIAAARIWLIFCVLLWFIGLALLFAFLELRPKQLHFWLLAFVGLRFEPVLSSLTYGQVNILLYVLVIASLYSLKKDFPVWAGFFLAGAIMLKITPVVLLAYYCLRKCYRVSIWTGVFFLLLLGISCASVGYSAHLKYALEVFPSLSNGFIHSYNQSIMAWFLRLFEAAGWSEQFPLARLLARLTGLGFVFATFWYLWKKPRPMSGYSPAEISLCILLISLVSPVSWSYHWVWVILPFAVIFRYMADAGFSLSGLVVLLATYAVVGIVDDYYVHPIFRSGPLVLVSSIKLYGLLILYFFLLEIVREEAVQGSDTTLMDSVADRNPCPPELANEQTKS